MTCPLWPERVTQNRVVHRFTSAEGAGGLGYRPLGAWHQRESNRCIEAALLRDNLSARGYTPAQISAALQRLESAADATGITLYQANLRTYQLLRYGVPVQTGAGQAHETVHLIDWEHPDRNDFAVAEEVTLMGGYQRRPDIVLYLNGLAVAVVELKRSSVELADGVRQLITNQEEIFRRSESPCSGTPPASGDARQGADNARWRGRAAPSPRQFALLPGVGSMNASGSSSSALMASSKACWSVSNSLSHTCEVPAASTISRIQSLSAPL